MYSVSIVHVGESTVEIKTEADSNDITESSYPLHNKPSIGVCGFLCCYYVLVSCVRSLHWFCAVF